MKKATLVILLALSSTYGFSQNNQIATDAIPKRKLVIKKPAADPATGRGIIQKVAANPAGKIPGIEVIVKKPAVASATNRAKDPMISQINELENKYKAALLAEWEKNQDLHMKRAAKKGVKLTQKSFLEDGMGSVQRDFSSKFHRIKGHEEMKSKSVWNAYGDFLDYVIEVYTNDMEAAGITGKWFDEY